MEASLAKKPSQVQTLFHSMRCQISALQLLMRFVSAHCPRDSTGALRGEIRTKLRLIEEHLDNLTVSFETMLRENEEKKEEAPELLLFRPPSEGSKLEAAREDGCLDISCELGSRIKGEPFDAADMPEPVFNRSSSRGPAFLFDNHCDLPSPLSPCLPLEMSPPRCSAGRKKGAGRKTVNPCMESKMVSWTCGFISRECNLTSQNAETQSHSCRSQAVHVR